MQSELCNFQHLLTNSLLPSKESGLSLSPQPLDHFSLSLRNISQFYCCTKGENVWIFFPPCPLRNCPIFLFYFNFYKDVKINLLNGSISTAKCKPHSCKTSSNLLMWNPFENLGNSLSVTKKPERSQACQF